MPVRIPPQPARALQHLVENAGRLVSRRELQQVLWGDGRHVDFEQGLNYCIRQVREALGDTAEASRHIVTVPRRGYRFAAPIEGLGEVPSAARRPPARWWAPALTALVLLAAGAGWVTWRGNAPKPAVSAAPLVPRLAVTPFAAPAAEDATAARVLYEELLVDLEQHGPVVEIVTTERAAADFRLEGSVYRRAEELTLALRLLRAADGVAVWNTTFRQPAADDDWLDWPQRAAHELAGALAAEAAGSAPAGSG